MKITWTGAEEFAEVLEGAGATDGVLRAAGRGLYTGGEAIMAVSKRRTPVDTGRLRASAWVSLPERHGNRVRVNLNYGTEYAIFVHEILSARHNVGQAKFLASAVNDTQDKFNRIFTNAILSELGW